MILSNQFIVLRFGKLAGRPGLTGIENKLSGQATRIYRDDFQIGLDGRAALTAKDFAFQKAYEEAVPGGKRLRLRLSGRQVKADLDIVYELKDNESVVRRWLELDASEPLPLRQVDVWLVGLKAGSCDRQESGVPHIVAGWVGYTDAYQGFGVPLFLDDTFWGLEYPAGYNHYEGGLVTLRQSPGRTVTGKFTSRKAVMGVSEPGAVRPSFMEYLDGFRAHRHNPELLLNYNNYGTCDSWDRDVMPLIDLFRTKLYEPYKTHFDLFAMDDGWDKKKSMWEVDRGRFPAGLKPLEDGMKTIETGLGLWLSPSSGYGHNDWCASQGYEVSTWKLFSCMSDPRYRKDIVSAMTDLQKTNDLRYFKFDGFSAPCQETNHTHLPGTFAKDANVDAYLELLTAMRETRPDVFLNLTCGAWLSPWWLMVADSVWGVMQDGHARPVLASPLLGYSEITTRDALLRKRCRENPGFPIGAIETLDAYTECYETLDDHVMAAASRGNRLISFYLNPGKMLKADRDWEMIASLINWARSNQHILGKTQIILGEPLEREAYGYAHFNGLRGILFVRNPFIQPQSTRVALDKTSGWDRPEADRYVARLVYPRRQTLGQVRCGDSLKLDLQGHETVVVQLDPVDPNEPMLTGLRYIEKSRTGKRLTCEVYVRPGSSEVLSVGGKLRLLCAQADGRTIRVPPSSRTVRLPAGAGKDNTCKATGARIQVQAIKDANLVRMTGTCTAHVPAGVKATVHILCIPGMASAYIPECSVRINGAPVKVRTTKPDYNAIPQQALEELPVDPWHFYSVDVPAGRNKIALMIDAPGADARLFKAEVGWWLWSEQPLRRSMLTLEFDTELPEVKPEPLPLPTQMDTERRVIVITPAQIHTAPARRSDSKKA